jgi:hypothetical protein
MVMSGILLTILINGDEWDFTKRVEIKAVKAELDQDKPDLTADLKDATVALKELSLHIWPYTGVAWAIGFLHVESDL